MRDFVAVTELGEIRLSTRARCARRAALKVATAGDTLAHILDPQLNKLHSYACGMRELKQEEQTQFTQAHSIKRKPIASKVGYTPVSNRVVYDALHWGEDQKRSLTEAVRRVT
tara:strand:+ start:1352 stop:1690 length:339 start_codon:yes stop_codon:yes gene_type:complete